MKGFVQGADRQQTTLLPECLDDWVDESNAVRAVDVFVDALELRELGFDGVTQRWDLSRQQPGDRGNRHHARRLDKRRVRTRQQYGHLCRVSRPSRGLLDRLDCQKTRFSDLGHNGFQAANNPNLGRKDGATRALRF